MVKQDMVRLLESGMAQDLVDAYEKATRVNPEIWEAIQQQRIANQEKEKAEAAKAPSAFFSSFTRCYVDCIRHFNLVIFQHVFGVSL